MTQFYGFDIFDPEMLEYYDRYNFNTLTTRLPFGYDFLPSQIEHLIIFRGLSKIVLKSGDLNDGGYDYRRIEEYVEAKRYDNKSFADLILAYPHVDWWIEIGNEPNHSGMTSWAARWWVLAVIKELKYNTVQHIEIPWSAKYPNLKWTTNTPTGYIATLEFLQHRDEQGLGGGGILDYFDGISVHLYGDYEVFSWNYDWPYIYHLLLPDNNRYVKKLLVTEMGINHQPMSMLAKATRYRQFISTSPAELVTIFTIGKNTPWPQYEITGRDALQFLSQE